MILTSARHDVQGIPTLVSRFSQSVDSELARIDSALTLLREQDSTRFRRLTNTCTKIVVGDFLGSAFWPLSNACALDSRRVLRGDPVALALVIVHESTHATLACRGVYSIRSRARRIEHVCVRQELNFLDRLDAAGFANVAAWKDFRAAQLKSEWWTERAQYERRRRELTARGAQRWLLWLHAAFFRPLFHSNDRVSRRKA